MNVNTYASTHFLIPPYSQSQLLLPFKPLAKFHVRQNCFVYV